MAGEALGPLLRRHPVDNARRGRLAVTCLTIGLVTILAGATVIWLLASRPQRSSVGDPYVAPIFVLGCGIGFLLGGLWLAGLYRSRGGEVFEVHEDGLAHQYGDHVRQARWDTVEKVVDTGKDNAFARALGGNVSCRVTFTDGSSPLTFTGLTRDAAQLVATAQTAVKQRQTRRSDPPAP